MNYIRINKFSKVPLYVQLYDSIKAAIQSGQLKDKDKLPPEEVLAETFNISRPVIRQAYRALHEEGLIDRFQGRGSYVRKRIEFSNIFFKQTFNEEVSSKGFKPSSQVISVDTILHEDLPPFHFPIPNHTSYYTLKRIRKADNIPLFYEIFFLPTSYFKDLRNHISDEFSITKLIRDIYGYQNLGSECLISAVSLDDSLSQLLEVEFESAAIKFDIIHYNLNKDIIFFKISYFPGERHSIDVDLHEDKT
jgi:GntR family transcriptional regulator